MLLSGLSCDILINGALRGRGLPTACSWNKSCRLLTDRGMTKMQVRNRSGQAPNGARPMLSLSERREGLCDLSMRLDDFVQEAADPEKTGGRQGG